jgi:hypothetical protein
MASLKGRFVSPLAVYLDELSSGSALAARPATLDGKVVGLLPNWRPAAVHILTSLGELLKQRFRLKAIVMEQPVQEALNQTGKLLDRIGGQLDELARRVDVVIAASGD